MSIAELIICLLDINIEHGNIRVVMVDGDESPVPWRDCVVDYDEEYKVAIIS